MPWRLLLANHGCELTGEPVAAVELVAALLRIAIADQRTTTAGLKRSDLFQRLGTLENRVFTRLHRLLDRGRVEYLPATMIDHIVTALNDATRGAEPVPHDGAAALVVARVLDALLGTVFIDHFRGTRELRAGDPFPVVPFPFESLDEPERRALLAELGDRTGAPQNRMMWDDRVVHLRIATSDMERLRIRLKWADPWLDPVRATTSFAAVITNLSITPDFNWDRYEIAGRLLFYRVHATDPEEQAARVKRGIQRARDRKAAVAVLPELALTPALLEELRRENAFEGIGLVVAGSHHEPVSPRDPGANIAIVFANGHEIHRHSKFSDFHYAEDGQRRHEHLRSSDTDGFDLLIGPRCTLVVLICKDALDVRVRNLVQFLAPTLVLVPAMSPDVDDFRLLAEQLARDPQGFTVVASSGTPDGAIFGRPVRDHPGRSERISVPSVVLFSLGTGAEIFEIAKNLDLTN